MFLAIYVFFYHLYSEFYKTRYAVLTTDITMGRYSLIFSKQVEFLKYIFVLYAAGSQAS